jgi:hypothetical protein
MFAFVLHPVTTYAALAVGIGLCLALFLRLKMGLRSIEKKLQRGGDDLRSLCDTLKERVEQLQMELQEAQEQLKLSAGSPAKSLININKRTQALRLHRSGEPPQRIAAALGMTRGEVDLLIKVQSIVRNSYETNPTKEQDYKIGAIA